MSTFSKFCKKEMRNTDSMVDGFYKGVGATIGLVIVASAPEICIAAVVGAVVYKKIANLVEAKIEQRAEEIAAANAAK